MRFLVVFGFGAMLACAGVVLAEPKVVSVSDVPPVVGKTIQMQTGGGVASTIEIEDEGSAKTYEVFFTKAGQERSISVAEDGTLLLSRLSVALAETPAAVQTTILAQLGDIKPDGIDKVFEDGEFSFEIEFTTKDGQERSLTVAPDGALMSLEILLSNAPPGVQSRIRKNVGDGTIIGIEKVFDEGTITYDVEYATKAGKTLSLVMNGDGKGLSSKEVILADVDEAVQNTIKGVIGRGVVFHVNKTYGGPKHAAKGYEVDGTLNGKRIAFGVDLKGKFLGMQ